MRLYIFGLLILGSSVARASGKAPTNPQGLFDFASSCRVTFAAAEEFELEGTSEAKRKAADNEYDIVVTQISRDALSMDKEQLLQRAKELQQSYWAEFEQDDGSYAANKAQRKKLEGRVKECVAHAKEAVSHAMNIDRFQSALSCHAVARPLYERFKSNPEKAQAAGLEMRIIVELTKFSSDVLKAEMQRRSMGPADFQKRLDRRFEQIWSPMGRGGLTSAAYEKHLEPIMVDCLNRSRLGKSG